MLMLLSLSYHVLHGLDHTMVRYDHHLSGNLPSVTEKQSEADLCRFTGTGSAGDRAGDVDTGGFIAFFPTVAPQQLLSRKDNFILVILFGAMLSRRALKRLYSVFKMQLPALALRISHLEALAAH